MVNINVSVLMSNTSVIQDKMVKDTEPSFTRNYYCADINLKHRGLSSAIKTRRDVLERVALCDL